MGAVTSTAAAWRSAVLLGEVVPSCVGGVDVSCLLNRPPNAPRSRFHIRIGYLSEEWQRCSPAYFQVPERTPPLVRKLGETGEGVMWSLIHHGVTPQHAG